MFKNFSSQFSEICEGVTSRFESGGILMGDFVKILPKAFKLPAIKDRPREYLETLKHFMDSENPLKVVLVKSDKVPMPAGLMTAGEAPDVLWVDLVMDIAPGLSHGRITVPMDAVERVDTGGNAYPDFPDSWKYDNREVLKGETVEAHLAKSNKETPDTDKQTEGSKRKLATKNTK